MDKTKLFEHYEDRDDDLENNGLDLAAKFKAAGKTLSYYGATDLNTGNPVVVVSSHGSSFAEAAQNGTILQLEPHQKPYDRAQIIERGVQGGLSQDDATRLATSNISYEDLDSSFNLTPRR